MDQTSTLLFSSPVWYSLSYRGPHQLSEVQTITIYENNEKETSIFSFPSFSPFPALFSKDFFTRVVKTQDCLVKNYCKWLHQGFLKK